MECQNVVQTVHILSSVKKISWTIYIASKMSKSVFCNSFATLAGGVEALQEEHELEAASDGSPSETGAERPVRRQP